MDRQQFQSWLDGYVEAWKTYDPDKIGALFAADIQYSYGPSIDPLVGRAAVVASWLDNKDAPGTYDAEYKVLAVDGDTFVANGHSDYFDGAGGPLRDQYFNMYVCHFNDKGECTKFSEQWMQSREFRRRDREELIRKVRAGEEV